MGRSVHVNIERLFTEARSYANDAQEQHYHKFSCFVGDFGRVRNGEMHIASLEEQKSGEACRSVLLGCDINERNEDEYGCTQMPFCYAIDALAPTVSSSGEFLRRSSAKSAQKDDGFEFGEDFRATERTPRSARLPTDDE